MRQALSHRPGELFAAVAGGTLREDEVAELRLGKKTTALYAEAKALHGQLDRYAYGPPPVRIAEAEADQARAAGVLLELDRTQVILGRAVYRELVKAAVAHYLGTGDHVARTLAANGIRLVLDEQRTTTTPTLKRTARQDEGQLRRARGRPEVAVEVRRRRQERR